MLQGCERARAALAWHLGVAEEDLSAADTSFVLCNWAQYLEWIDALGMPSREREWVRNLAAFNHPRAYVGHSRDPEWARELAASMLTGRLVDGRHPRVPAWLQEGLRFLVLADAVDATRVFTTSRDDYGSRTRDRDDSEERLVGNRFNPKYLTARIERKQDEDLRLLVGRKHVNLTADDDVKAYFFVRWLVREGGPLLRELDPWLRTIGSTAREREEPPAGGLDGPPADASLQAFEAAFVEPFALPPESATLEEVDRRFRQDHAAKYPLIDPEIALGRKALAGRWEPTAASRRALEKAVHGRVVHTLLLREDGTFEESRLHGKPPALERRGTWTYLGGRFVATSPSPTGASEPLVRSGTVVDEKIHLGNVILERKDR
jgi:hypothetical protein